MSPINCDCFRSIYSISSSRVLIIWDFYTKEEQVQSISCNYQSPCVRPTTDCNIPAYRTRLSDYYSCPTTEQIPLAWERRSNPTFDLHQEVSAHAPLTAAPSKPTRESSFPSQRGHSPIYRCCWRIYSNPHHRGCSSEKTKQQTSFGIHQSFSYLSSQAKGSRLARDCQTTGYFDGCTT